MKVVQIIPYFPFGGAEIMCENLTYELISQGTEVTIISLYTNRTELASRIEKNGVKIVYLGKKSGLDLSMVSKIKKVLKEEQPDVVHIHLSAILYAVPAARGAKIKKRIHTIHSAATKTLPLPYRIACRIFYKWFKTVPVALSKVVQDAVAKEYRIKKQNIPIVFNGVDLKKCVCKNGYDANNTFTFVHVGRFSEPKNHIMILAAFKLFNKAVPNSRLLLLGDGELRQDVEDYIKKNSLVDSVKLLGVQSDVHSYLNEADAFLLPSKWEGVPLSLIEAMGTGLPIIATNVGGIPDMLQNEESALLVNVNEKEIAEAMMKIYSSKEFRELLGKNALRASNSFSAEKMAKEYLKIYDSRV